MKDFFINVLHEEPLDRLTLESIKGGNMCICNGPGTFTCTCHGEVTYYCVCNGGAKYACTTNKIVDPGNPTPAG